MTMSNETVRPQLSESAAGDLPSSAAADVAKTAAGKASEVAGSAVENIKAVAGEASTQSKVVVAQAKDQVHSLAQQTKGELMTQADVKSQQAVSGLKTLSAQIAALRDGRPNDAGQLTQFVGEAEEKVSALAERIERGGPQGVLDDLTAFARRRPAAFVLGAIGAGFVAGRVIRSGAAAASDQHEPEPASIASPSVTTPTPVPALTGSVMDSSVTPGTTLITPPAFVDGLERSDAPR